MGELFDKLKELEYEDILPMHMPGAKRNKELISMPDPVKIDITEVTGFDNLHHATGIIRDCAKEAARLYGADEAFLLVNGSSAGIMAAICGAAKAGDNVIVARNVHRSVINSLYLGQLNPVYIYPDMINREAGIYGEVKAEEIEAILKDRKDNDIKAVIITSPTYEGIVSDVRAIADVVHRYGAVLIVDEAHGAHFGFHEAFPVNAVRLGADAVIMSIHKTLPAFTQTALLMVNYGRIDVERIRMYWNMYQSTSPSYILMASIDNCITLLKDNAKDLFDKYVERLIKLREEIGKLKYIKLLETDDISKIVLIVKDGALLSRQLREIYKIELEMASEKYVIAMTSIGDTDEGYVRFLQALRNLDNEEFDISLDSDNDSIQEYMSDIDNNVYPRIVMSIYDALNANIDMVELEASAGCIAGDAVCIYPPGINLVNPGEVVTEDIINMLKSGKEHGLEVLGLTEDMKIKCVRGFSNG